MNYEILGSIAPAVEITLSRGESLFTQSGGMSWQSEGIKMETNAKGGMLKGIGRMFSGESFFMVTYSAMTDEAKIAFAATAPGQIMPVNVNEYNGIILQKGAFLCAQEGVELSSVFTKKFSSGLFGGEGFILQKLTGSGMAFLEVDGDPVIKELAPGEVIKVDSGNVVAFDASVNYEIETVKGVGNILFGGEGLFLTKLTGPGRVIMQTMSINELAGRIRAYIPSK